MQQNNMFYGLCRYNHFSHIFEIQSLHKLCFNQNQQISIGLPLYILHTLVHIVQMAKVAETLKFGYFVFDIYQ